jgi:hypothetical protein
VETHATSQGEAGGSAPVDQTAASSSSAASAISDGDSPIYDSWEIDEQLRHIQRTLQNDSGKVAPDAGRQCEMRFDSPQAALPSNHVSMSGRLALPRKAAVRQRNSGSGVLVWLALAIGTTGFVCGSVLLAWSFVAGRNELWTFGLPAMLIGQIALLVGLALQLDRLRRDNRAASSKLNDMDLKLCELTTTAASNQRDDPESAANSAQHRRHDRRPTPTSTPGYRNLAGPAHKPPRCQDTAGHGHDGEWVG